MDTSGAQRAGLIVSDRPSVIQSAVVLLGLIVVTLVSLTGLIGVREGQPA
jgi:hypothetical protein